MASTNFVDYVKTFCRSGAGGRGSAHLHRDKRTMKGGPDGGDGGRGGNVIVRGNRNYWTLIHLKYQRHVFAGDGGNGSEDRSTGADGEDVTIEVPLGTVARDAETGETICEITQDGESFILVKGGRGGLGNWNFRSATNQTPRFAQPGELGLQIFLQLFQIGLAAGGAADGVDVQLDIFKSQSLDNTSRKAYHLSVSSR